MHVDGIKRAAPRMSGLDAASDNGVMGPPSSRFAAGELMMVRQVLSLNQGLWINRQASTGIAQVERRNANANR